jgi:hypothetical protein
MNNAPDMKESFARGHYKLRSLRVNESSDDMPVGVSILLLKG